MSQFTCADCGVKACRSHEPDKYPKECPTRDLGGEENLKYYSEEELKIAHFVNNGIKVFGNDYSAYYKIACGIRP